MTGGGAFQGLSRGAWSIRIACDPPTQRSSHAGDDDVNFSGLTILTDLSVSAVLSIGTVVAVLT